MDERRSGIENTLQRYAWAFDMDELDLMGGCFTADAEVEFMGQGWKVGRDAVAGELRRRRGNYVDGRIPWHVISNVYITEPTATSARVRTWYTIFVQEPDGEQHFTGMGWYDDRFVVEDGTWRVSWRRVCPAQSAAQR